MYVSLSDRLYMSFTVCISSRRSCTLSETYSHAEKLRKPISPNQEDPKWLPIA